MADALETLQTLPLTYDIDALMRELEASRAELTKSRMVIGMLRSPGLPAVTMKPPVFDSYHWHDASADKRAALVATTSALNFMSQNGSAKVPRKLKLTPFKTTKVASSNCDHCESSQGPVLRGNIHRGTVESLHGATPAKKSHASATRLWQPSFTVL